MIETIGAQYIEIVQSLHEHWTPHTGQIKVGQAIFRDGKTSIFVQCGRKWGKTEIAAYILWRVAQSIPESPCYFIAPFQKQAREIVWSNNRIQNFGPRDWLFEGSEGINQTEMRLKFRNGSFVKVDGSDNYEAYRGPEYKVCIYEEFKDHHPEFRKAMRPNAAVLKGIDIYIGSPPDHECDYTEVAKEHREDPEKFFHQAPTWENPVIDRKWLQDEKAQHYRKGEGDVWEREYEARIVKGGKASVFPMIHSLKPTPHTDVMGMLRRDMSKLQYFTIADPGASSCFGMLIIGLNPYNKKIYLFDEIYETDPSKTTVTLIGREMIQKQDDIYRKAEWTEVYDEAEAWFRNEMGERYNRWFMPTNKAQNDKESAISLIRDLLLRGKLIVSDRCVKFMWEMTNYIKDKKGKIPKANDHLIDCFRYFLAASNYTLESEVEPLPEDKNEDFRGARPEDDFPGLGDISEDEFYE